MQFPVSGELTTQSRPRPYVGVSTRLSPADAWFLAGAVWLLACAGIARFVMTRNALWLVATGLAVSGLTVLGGMWVLDAQVRARDESLPLLIVSEDTTLRRGNASAYLPRFDSSVLPKGAEVRELARRGGWVQVQLPGGAIGWIPESAVIACDR